jgi:hypothetical protein
MTATCGGGDTAGGSSAVRCKIDYRATLMARRGGSRALTDAGERRARRLNGSCFCGTCPAAGPWSSSRSPPARRCIPAAARHPTQRARGDGSAAVSLHPPRRSPTARPPPLAASTLSARARGGGVMRSFLAWIGSPCLRPCVHGASVGLSAAHRRGRAPTGRTSRRPPAACTPPHRDRGARPCHPPHAPPQRISQS